MRIFIWMLCIGLAPLLFALPEEVMPEPSEPPFQVGDLPLEAGYTIERDDAPDLNFRIVDQRMRLYWLDEDGLIMEPAVSAVTIRFDRSTIRGPTRDIHKLQQLDDDTALGSPYILVPPFIYNITLVIGASGSDELASFRFRFTPEMNKVKEPTPD